MLMGIVTEMVSTSNSRPLESSSLSSLSMSTKGTSAVRVMVSSSPPMTA